MNLHKNAASRRAMLKTGVWAAAWGLAGTMAALPAMAEEWPTRPVKIVIALGAGSSGDTLARMIGPKLEARWKQPVIVDNKPGASGVVGTEYVVNARDDHTLLLGTQSSILPKYTQKGLRFDPLTDLVPVRKVLNYQIVIATNGETAKQAGTLRDLVAFSKKGGKGIFLSGLGPTSVFNLSFAILNRQLGIEYSAVNFNNINEMNLALLRNDTQFILNNPASIRSHFGTGALVPLAVVGSQRYASLPEVPTLQQALGYKGYLPQLWAGFFVPRNMPAAIVERINRDLQAIFEDEAFRKEVEAKLSASVVVSSPDAFAREIREETAIWQNLFRTLNIKPE